MVDIFAHIFYTIAKIPIIQKYYIHKYGMYCAKESDRWNCIYSCDTPIQYFGNNDIPGFAFFNIDE